MSERLDTAERLDADEVHDVAIIGAGPIGIELGVAIKQSDLTVLHLDAGPIGSTMAWWAPGTKYFSSPERIEIAGAPLITPDQDKATREQYMAYLRGVVQQFNLNIHTFTRVTNITRATDHFVLESIPSTHGVGGPAELVEQQQRSETSRARRNGEAQVTDSITGRRVFRAKNIVLAIGNMHVPRTIDVPGEDLPHVSHYLDDPHRYFGRDVLIVGGKNSAVEAALRLYRVGARVAISYRGETFDRKRVKYWLRPELEWLIEKEKITFHPRTVVCAIDRDTVTLADIDSADQQYTIPADDVLLMTGYIQSGDLFDQLGIAREGEARAPVHDEHTMQTNVPGVYVAGTAAAGSQKRTKLFIENSHIHVERIARALAGVDVPWITAPEYASLEEA